MLARPAVSVVAARIFTTFDWFVHPTAPASTYQIRLNPSGPCATVGDTALWFGAVKRTRGVLHVFPSHVLEMLTIFFAITWRNTTPRQPRGASYISSGSELYPFSGLSMSGAFTPAAGDQCSQSGLVASDGFSTKPFDPKYGVNTIQQAPPAHGAFTRMKSGWFDWPVRS